MNWEAVVNPAFCSRLCLTMLHSIWQLVLVAVALRAAERVLHRRSVQMTYAVYVAGLVGCLAALPLTFALVDVPAAAPAAGLSERHGRTLPDGNADEPGRPAASRTVFLAPEQEAKLRQEGGDPAKSQLPLVASPQALAPPSTPSEATDPERKPNHWLPAWHRWSPWVVGLYVAGVLAMLARLAGGVWTAHRLCLRAETICEGPLVDLLRTVATRWSTRVVPTLARAQAIVVPKVVGLLRPTILLPVSATTGLSMDELEMILAHELAHVRRHDMWVNLLQRLAETVLFFNPAVWYVSRRISTLREYCCDEMVCQAMAKTRPEPQARYASALLHVVELGREANRPNSSEHRELAALAAAGRSPSELRCRVARLLGEPVRAPLRLSRGGVLAVAALTAVLVICTVLLPTAAEFGRQPAERNNTGSRMASAPPSVTSAGATAAWIPSELVEESRARTNAPPSVTSAGAAAWIPSELVEELPARTRTPDENASKAAAAAARTVRVRITAGEEKKPVVGLEIQALKHYGPSAKLEVAARSTTDAQGVAAFRLSPGHYSWHFHSEQELPYVLRWRPTWEVKPEPAEQEFTHNLYKACELVLRAVDVDTGRGIPGVKFGRENSEGEIWMYHFKPENLGAKRDPAGRAYESDVDGYYRCLVGFYSGFSYMVLSCPPGYEVAGFQEVPFKTTPGGRMEHTFKLRRKVDADVKEGTRSAETAPTTSAAVDAIAPEHLATAEEFLRYFKEGRIEEARRLINTRYAGSELERIQASFHERAGPFQEVLSYRNRRILDRTVLEARCRWERAVMLIRLLLDEDGEIDGFWLARDPEGPTPEGFRTGGYRYGGRELHRIARRRGVIEVQVVDSQEKPPPPLIVTVWESLPAEDADSVEQAHAPPWLFPGKTFNVPWVWRDRKTGRYWRRAGDYVGRGEWWGDERTRHPCEVSFTKYRPGEYLVMAHVVPRSPAERDKEGRTIDPRRPRYYLHVDAKSPVIPLVLSRRVSVTLVVPGEERSSSGEKAPTTIESTDSDGVGEPSITTSDTVIERTNQNSQVERTHRQPGERMARVIVGVDFAFRWCPPGEFLMGAPESAKELYGYKFTPQHKVRITRGFWLQETEVTQRQYPKMTGRNPSYRTWRPRDDHPVEQVNWHEAVEFCEKLSRADPDYDYRLPTEAQWEYACRAGSTESRYGELDEIAWYYYNTEENFEGTTGHRPVGRKEPNAWGLHDMLGNVEEWCADWYGPPPRETTTDPTGPATRSGRVYRGGNWSSYGAGDPDGECRAATRSGCGPERRDYKIGFRVVLIPEGGGSLPGETTQEAVPFYVTVTGGKKEQPLEGILVTPSAGPKYLPGAKAVTNARGIATFQLLPGDYRFSFDADRELPYISRRCYQTVKAGEEGQGLAHNLDEACELVLRAVDVATGRGVPGVKFARLDPDVGIEKHVVTPCNLGHKHDPTEEAYETDSDGYFRCLVDPRSSYLYCHHTIPREYEILRNGWGKPKTPSGGRAEFTLELRRKVGG